MGVDDVVDISPTKSKQRTLSYDCVAIAIGSWGKKDEKPKMLPFLLSSFSVQPKGSPLMAYRSRGGTDYGLFFSRFQIGERAQKSSEAFRKTSIKSILSARKVVI